MSFKGLRWGSKLFALWTMAWLLGMVPTVGFCLATAMVRSSPEGAEVSLIEAATEREVVLGKCPFTVKLPSGSVRLKAHLEDWPDLRRSVVLINESDNAVDLVFPQGTVDVRSRPPGASISWGGKVLGKTPARVALPSGAQDLVLNLPGWDAIRESVGVQQGKDALVEVEFPCGKIGVSCNVSGAFVDVDGKEVGTAPCEVPVPPGEYAIRVRHPLLPAQSRLVQVRRDQSAAANFHFGFGGVQIESEPAGAEVSLLGKPAVLGMTPLKIDFMEVGTQQFVIRKPGYRGERLSLRVSEGEVARHATTLVRWADLQGSNLTLSDGTVFVWVRDNMWVSREPVEWSLQKATVREREMMTIPEKYGFHLLREEEWIDVFGLGKAVSVSKWDDVEALFRGPFEVDGAKVAPRSGAHGLVFYPGGVWERIASSGLENELLSSVYLGVARDGRTLYRWAAWGSFKKSPLARKDRVKLVPE